MRAIEAGLKVLVRRGVRYVFGVPAGSINALYDAMIDMPDIEHIIAKHETGAGYMACAYTRISGIPSICTGSSGPGATNLVTSIANAWNEKLPLIVITGSVPLKARGHGGAQELDSEPIFAPITKMSTTVLDAQKLPDMLDEAYEIAVSGVPGPVHLAIPIDVQMTEIDYIVGKSSSAAEQTTFIPDTATTDFAELIQEAGARGAILAGYGAKVASSSLLRFAELTGWPVATTPRGKGAFPDAHPLSLGVYGLAGNARAIQHMNSDQFDVLFVVGSSLGELATCNWEPALTQGKKLVHLDFNAAQFHKNYRADLAICARTEVFLKQMVDMLQEHSTHAEVATTQVEQDANESKLPVSALDDNHAWDTQSVVQHINRCAPKNTRFYSDIGEHMTYALQNIRVADGQDFDININFGGMGSGISGAIGAQIAEPNRPVVCITGDGCFFMHGMEMLTAKEYGVPLVLVVINNSRLGMVYHGHMLQYRRSPEDFSQQRVSIAKAAEALGIQAVAATSWDDLRQEHFDAWFSAKEPVVVEVILDGNETPPMGERVKFLEGATY